MEVVETAFFYIHVCLILNIERLGTNEQNRVNQFTSIISCGYLDPII